MNNWVDNIKLPEEPEWIDNIDLPVDGWQNNIPITVTPRPKQDEFREPVEHHRRLW